MRLAVGDKDAMKYEAYINGVKEKHCIMADEEEGVAEMYVMLKLSAFMELYPENAAITFHGDDIPTAIVRGKVELRRMEC